MFTDRLPPYWRQPDVRRGVPSVEGLIDLDVALLGQLRQVDREIALYGRPKAR